MELKQSIIDIILQAEAKALATQGISDVNVVPISTIKVVDGSIWLMNYFMGETLVNILDNPQVALACWKGLSGIKIKAVASYAVQGEQFEEAKAWVAQVQPTRTLKGLIVLTPTAVYDITPTETQAGKLLQ